MVRHTQTVVPMPTRKLCSILQANATLFHMRRFITALFLPLIFTVFCGSILLRPVFVHAAGADPYGLEVTRKKTQFSGVTKTLPQLIGSVISVALSLVGFVFLGLALYAGFKWMTAQGNEKDVTSARDTLINASIGIVLIVAAYAITNFVFTNVITQIQ